MRKFRNWAIGGIQHKVFNLVLIVIVLMVAAYTAVIIYQTKSIQENINMNIVECQYTIQHRVV